MTALPFVVAPRQHGTRYVGTLDSGILEIPICGGLTVDESATVSQLLSADVSAFVHAAKLADAIATEEGITQPEAFAIIEQTISGGTLEPKADLIRIKHAERIEAVAAIYSAAGQRNIEASVTAIIRHRLDRGDWSIEQTRKLPRVLLNDIWRLIMDEQEAENLPTNRPSEEELKKQRPASGSSRKRIGSASSGGFATLTPAPSAETATAES
jgi:hypothetical protein